MRKTNKNLTKQILTLMLTFVLVFTGMGIGSWGVDQAWADGTYNDNYLRIILSKDDKTYEFVDQYEIDRSETAICKVETMPEDLSGATITLANLQYGEKLITTTIDKWTTSVSKTKEIQIDIEGEITYKLILESSSRYFKKLLYNYGQWTRFSYQEGVDEYKDTGIGLTVRENVAKASELKLEGCTGRILKIESDYCEPKDSCATPNPDGVSAVVNWYKANGEIRITISNSDDDTTGKTFTVKSRRRHDVTTGASEHGTIKKIKTNWSAIATDDWSCYAYPEEGYKVTNAYIMATLPDETEEVRYSVKEVDAETNLLTFRAPYADGTVYAEFAPLADGEQSSAVQVKSFTIAGVKGTIDESFGDYIRITGLPKSLDLSQVQPEVTLSKGAQAQAEPLDLRGGKMAAYKITAENGQATRTYWVTATQEPFYGSGTAEDPYRIETADDLVALAQNGQKEPYRSAYYKQTEDLDMTGKSMNSIGGVNTTYGFAGTYDGNGKTISNLNVSYLFDTVTGEIRDLTLAESCTFKNASVARWLGSGKVINCKNYGSILPTFIGTDWSNNANAGGIVQQAESGAEITGCENYGKIEIQSDKTNFSYIGGIAASISNAVIRDCHNYASLNAGKPAEGYHGSTGNYAGGIVGRVTTASIYKGNNRIIGCSNRGSVTAGGYVGGILAEIPNNSACNVLIESCFNTGTLTATNQTEDQHIGGIVGMGFDRILNCYHAGTLEAGSTSGRSYRGGILGYVAKGTGAATLAHNYSVQSASLSVGGHAEDAVLADDTTLMLASSMQEESFIDTLNRYEKPVSLYAVTFAMDSQNQNDGYPVIGELEKIKNYNAAITAFSLNGRLGVIDQEAGTITVMLPYNTDLTALTPTIVMTDGASVTPEGAKDFTEPVKYTVTSEDGSYAKVYTVKVQTAASAEGFSFFRVRFNISNEELVLDENDTITVSDLDFESYSFSIDYLTADGSEAKALISGSNTGGGLVDKEITKSWDSGAYDIFYISNWMTGSIGGGYTSGEKTIKILYGENFSKERTITIKVIPSLKTENFSIKSGETVLNIKETADGYRVDLPDGTENITVNAEANNSKVTVSINGERSTSKELTVSELKKNTFDIVLADPVKPEIKRTYHITLNPVKSCKVSFDLTPENAAITLLDQDGSLVEPDANGEYTLISGSGYSYTYRISCAGYVTRERTLDENRLNKSEKTFDIELTKVGSGSQGSELEDLTGDWTSFRGSSTNMGLTSAKTPKIDKTAKLLWQVSSGSGWSASPTPQLLVDGYLYFHSGRKIVKINPKNGEVAASAEIAGSNQYTTNPLAYGEGMIFVLLDGGKVQALNAKTLESLWISEELGGQNISPLIYHNGYIYTGTWKAEDKDGVYYCLSVTDEDASKTDEIKHPMWQIKHKGGFYWTGAYATDNYVIFGSDDGTSGYNSPTATLYSVNPTTGKVIDTITGIIGDIRSTIAYADGYVFFTTKAGYLYRVSVDANGNLSEAKYFQMSGMSTGTPVVSDGTVFVTCSGKDQFNSPGTIYAVDVNTMQEITKAETPGYVQSSMLLSTAYKESEKALYLYATYNKEPGGLYALKYDLGSKTSFTGKEIFTPSGSAVQYNICSPIADADGVIYFKNDSGHIFALKERGEDEIAIASVAFRLNGGSAAGIQDGDRIEYYAGDEGKTLPIPSKSGYTFKGWFSENNTSSQQYTQVSAKLPQTLYAIWEKTAAPTPSEDGKITVKFRLIGAEVAKRDVDLSKNTYLPNYVTWISTKTYRVPVGTTVGEVFKKATAEAGIEYAGYENNYISTMKAPASLGGKWLGEFTNGPKSGWMYTVNNSHPNKGLVDWVLSNNDFVVWHYVNDYSYEVEDWFDDPNYPSLAKKDKITKYYNGWLKAADVVGSAGGGIAAGVIEEEVKDVTTDTKTGTTTAPTEVKVSEKTNADGTKTKVADVKVSADNQKEILKQAKEKKSNEIILVVSGKEVGDAAKADVTLDKNFIDSIVKDTNAKLTIKTPFGDKTYTQDELKAMSEAATGSTVTVVIEKAAEEPTDDAAAKIAKAKSIVKDMKLVARSSKTAKKNIKAVLKSDAKVKASIKELKDLGFTVKYRFYRSTKKAASYKAAVTKKTAAYTNTSGKKGTKYFYKVQVRVYDENGKLIAKTALKQCKYASRTWSK